MNVLFDLRLLGWLLVVLGGVQLLPASAALLFGEPALPYLASAAVAAVFGLPMALASRAEGGRVRVRDAFLLVGVSWLLASLFGALPYLTSGVLGPVDALFEAAAGFTTTNASALRDVEAAPRALLLWRAMTQWLGGLAVLGFTIAVVPALGISGLQLFNAEGARAVGERLTSRLGLTARRLAWIYGGLTALAFGLLWVAGLGAFDALCHALTSVSTGGFSTRSGSVGAFASASVEAVLILFMLLGGVNFVLHYRLVTGRAREVFADAELRYFGLVLVGATAAVAWSLADAGSAGAVWLRSAVFQCVSLATGTGYHTADWTLWPSLAQLVLLVLILLGGMSGSTSGGLKAVRSLLGLRALQASFQGLLHPHELHRVKYATRAVGEDEIAAVWAFVLAYLLIASACAGVLAYAGSDLITAFSAALSALGNVGPGLGEVGPGRHFGDFPTYAKLTLAFCMIAGRLEIFAVLVLLTPAFWRR